MGNLQEQSWDEVMYSPTAEEIRGKVATCTQNCWMVTTARTAMRNPRLPMLPKSKPLFWVIENKIKVTLGMKIDFRKYIDYNNVRKDASTVVRPSYLGIKGFKRRLQRTNDPHYIHIGEFYNR